MANPTLSQTFQEYFDVQLADDPQSLREVYALRYRVYCEEFGFEESSHFPDHLEQDEFDQQSLHCLIRHRPTGSPAGCVRMVPTFASRDTDPLPFEKYCSASLDERFFTALDLPRESLCEVSRLAVAREFRKRRGESQNMWGAPDTVEHPDRSERRTFPLIAVSAFLASTALSMLSGRHNAFMVTEPFLPRLLARAGIRVKPVGNPIYYHGYRAPYYITATEAEAGLRGELRELYQEIHRVFANHSALQTLQKPRHHRIRECQ
ncbi:PEP-CTERM/exosortase system-associated acyltransferase [Pseudomaricurvus sp. HS19]|uniref:PEP-CTERM/exosortase system-associated acyltransferase n=1 Tax=Pseudomaricurvus sp. HS19 TaxID=2692626 RepID=UPI00136DE68C|nr:PEP-CTERM/exosortase system-associated acyltransferase [Pseudomaricurvus sp. HS19]MYM62005.1 PEP-CTERM/exosortase system-associated acyltransferase [Pseudomaricurvus sp. HS19]